MPIVCRFYDYPFLVAEKDAEGYTKLDVVHQKCPDQLSPCGMLPMQTFLRFGIQLPLHSALRVCGELANDLVDQARLWFAAGEYTISRYAYIDIESALGTSDVQVRLSCNVIAQVITYLSLYDGIEVYYNGEGFYGRRPFECVAVPPGSPIIQDGEYSTGTLFIVNSSALNVLTLFPQLKRIARLVEVGGLES